MVTQKGSGRIESNPGLIALCVRPIKVVCWNQLRQNLIKTKAFSRLHVPTNYVTCPSNTSSCRALPTFWRRTSSVVDDGVVTTSQTLNFFEFTYVPIRHTSQCTQRFCFKTRVQHILAASHIMLFDSEQRHAGNRYVIITHDVYEQRLSGHSAAACSLRPRFTYASSGRPSYSAHRRSAVSRHHPARTPCMDHISLSYNCLQKSNHSLRH